jgi:hypothetical protein
MLILGGAGIAVAEPGGSSTTTDTGTGQGYNARAPEPTCSTPHAADFQTVARHYCHQLVGSGRPGHRPRPGSGARRPNPAAGTTNRTVGVLPASPRSGTDASAPKTSNADVRLPSTPASRCHCLRCPAPMVCSCRSIDRSLRGYATVDKFNTFNSLLADACAVRPNPAAITAAVLQDHGGGGARRCGRQRGRPVLGGARRNPSDLAGADRPTGHGRPAARVPGARPWRRSRSRGSRRRNGGSPGSTG